MEIIRLTSALCQQWLAPSAVAPLASFSAPIQPAVAVGSQITRLLVLASPIQLEDEA